MTNPPLSPGAVILFGSGETSPSGRTVFEYLLRSLPPQPRLALVETPSGFELNSAQVIERVAEFLRVRLQNYHPQVQAIPARQRGTPFSPDDPAIAAPLLDADLIFMGPGSPTYAVRQLQDSLTWAMLRARHRLGAPLVLASAAVVAISAMTLPVYEIYKVGAELHWSPGLDLFGEFGLPLVFVPHWNNSDGGSELDTSRCFMGQSRFARLLELLPPGLTVVGIDEKTALMLDLPSGLGRVMGQGRVTLIHTGHAHRARQPRPLEGGDLGDMAAIRGGHVHQYGSGETFPLAAYGRPLTPPPGQALPPEVWSQALAQHAQRAQPPTPDASAPPAAVQALLEARQAAREGKDWPAADALRRELAELGWQVEDTAQGQRVRRG